MQHDGIFYLIKPNETPGVRDPMRVYNFDKQEWFTIDLQQSPPADNHVLLDVYKDEELIIQYGGKNQLLSSCMATCKCPLCVSHGAAARFMSICSAIWTNDSSHVLAN